MSKPLVSIIIPVYNGSKYLGFAIESALSQTYSEVEVIVINDGSSDDGATHEVAARYGSRIRYYEKENGGVATALNLGIEVMNGEYFSWLSHDDAYYPNKIAKQIEFAHTVEKRKIILYSHEDIIDAAGKIIRKATGYPALKNPLPYTLLYHHFIGGCSLLIPRSAFEDAGRFDPTYRTVQDYDLWFRMIAKGYEFTYCPITSGMSRKHELQDSVSKESLHKIEKNTLFAQVMKELPLKYWLEPIAQREKALFTLAKEFKLQDLVLPYGTCMKMLQEGSGHNGNMERLRSRARFIGMMISIGIRFVLRSIKRCLKSMLWNMK